MFQLIISRGDHVDHLRGHQDHLLIFFAIFNLKLICHLSGQEAFFVWSLTQDPSLIWNTVITFSFRIHLLKVLMSAFLFFCVRVVQYSQIDSIGVSGDKKGLHWYQWYDWYQ